jgi:hypothetical protein
MRKLSKSSKYIKKSTFEAGLEAFSLSNWLAYDKIVFPALFYAAVLFYTVSYL